jgi:hypothetical protein
LKEKIQVVQKPVFSVVPGINKNFNVTQKQLPHGYIWNILQPKNVQIHPGGNKPISNAANKQKEARGPSDTQVYMCTVEYSLFAKNKKKIFAIIIHMSPVTQVISAGLLEYASDYSLHTHLLLECLQTGFSHYWQHLLLECLEIGFSHYWQCSISITTMKRQLRDSQAMTHYSKFGQLLKHSSGHLHTRRTDDHRQGNMPILRVHILLCLHQIWNKNF